MLKKFMGTGVNMQDEDSADEGKGRDDTGNEHTEAHMDQKRKFEEKKEEAGGNEEPESTDNIGEDAMLNEMKPLTGKLGR